MAASNGDHRSGPSLLSRLCGKRRRRRSIGPRINLAQEAFVVRESLNLGVGELALAVDRWPPRPAPLLALGALRCVDELIGDLLLLQFLREVRRDRGAV